MDDFKLSEANRKISDYYEIADHLTKLEEELMELADASMALRARLDEGPIPDHISEPAFVDFIEEFADVTLKMQHVERLLNNLGSRVEFTLHDMKIFKAARQLIRINTKDESFGSQKCRAES